MLKEGIFRTKPVALINVDFEALEFLAFFKLNIVLLQGAEYPFAGNG